MFTASFLLRKREKNIPALIVIGIVAVTFLSLSLGAMFQTFSKMFKGEAE